ncbi:MAG: PleD family two-component system response regulator [Rickettsiales bacterium]
MTAKVMIVDDLLPNIKLLKAKLEREFYQVITATNGVMALERLETERPDIILLDVMMPEMDGLETCRHIKANPLLSDIPVVMVTALSDKSDRIAGLTAGADDFLTKPINDVAMFARIRSLVRFKTMTDALKLRAQTGREFGNSAISMDKTNDISGSNILLIEDNETQLGQINGVLEKMRANAFAFSNPAAAVQSLGERAYDLIILDSSMSETNSLHLCANLRSQEMTANVPIILLIEEEDGDLLARGYDIGINDYLLTPLDGNEIKARCGIQLRRKRYQNALLDDQHKNLALSQIDALTGLYNRRYFDSYFAHNLREAVQQRKPLSLMILDVDHFKRVNDIYGHLAGDCILKAIASRIDVRAADLVARYGGEEFAVVMPNTAVSDAAKAGERIRQLVESAPFEVPGGKRPISLTVSVGVACAYEHDKADTLIERADEALYHIKNTTRNRVAVSLRH